MNNLFLVDEIKTNKCDTQNLLMKWERFYKADISRTSTAYGEYGLSLSIVKPLVDIHQGIVGINNEE